MSDLKNVKPLDDFNWDEFENGTSANVSKTDLEKAYDETLNKVTEHQVVEGTVISVDKKEVIVNIGYKSDGIIPASEFRYNPDLKVGDKVEVYVENQEDVKGQLVLSHKKARLSKSWERVNAALENEEVIQGYIKCRTKGFLARKPDRRSPYTRLRRIRRQDNGVQGCKELSSSRSSSSSVRRSSASSRRVRSSRVPLRTSLLTVYSLTSAVLTV